jgi:hypothetical protein
MGPLTRSVPRFMLDEINAAASIQNIAISD